MITSSTTSTILDATDNIRGSDFTGTTNRGFAFYDPQPVEVHISKPKKQRVLHLERAKVKEQLKVWGLLKR